MSVRTKQILANYLWGTLNEIHLKTLPGFERTEVQQISNLKCKLLVWEDDGPPRKFLIQVKEEL